MFKLSKVILLIFALAIASSCKKNATSAPKKMSELHLKQARAETTTVDEEFQSMKDSIAEYKASEDFKNPKTDADRAFNSLIDSADNMSKEQVVELIQSKKFHEFQNKIDTKFDKILATADKIVAVQDTAVGSGTDTGLAVATSTDTNSATTTTSGKNSVQQSTGIAMIVFASIGLLSAAGIGAGAYSANKKLSPVVEEFDTRVAGVIGTNTTHKAIQKKFITGSYATAVGLGLMWMMPMIIGTLIVSQDDPGEGAIKAAQASIGAGAVLTGLIGLGLIGLALTPPKKILTHLTAAMADSAISFLDKANAGKFTFRETEVDVGAYKERVSGGLKQTGLDDPKLRQKVLEQMFETLSSSEVQRLANSKNTTEAQVQEEVMKQLKASAGTGEKFKALVDRFDRVRLSGATEEVKMKEKVQMGSKVVLGARVGVGVLGAVFVGIGSGLAAWSSSLGLTADQLTPKEKVISKLSRAFISFQELEARAG